VLDGICGDQTIAFIEYFQEQAQLRRVGVELNGQVAPYGTAGTTTMGLLNETLKTLAFPGILGGLCPWELREAFYF